MERRPMRRAQPRRRLGWRGPLALVGVGVVAVSVILVGIAIYTCDLDEVRGTRGLSDELRALIDLERDKAPPDPDGRVMRVQGSWNGMTLQATEAVQPRGVLVAWIDPEEGDRARRAGIQPGDAIVGVDQRKVGGLADMRAASRKTHPGEPLMIHLLRQGQLLTLVLPAAPPPLPSLPAALGPSAYCPHDGVLVPPAQAARGTCPICGGPLYLYNPSPQVPR
jgi:PDZ domain-containing protein